MHMGLKITSRTIMLLTILIVLLFAGVFKTIDGKMLYVGGEDIKNYSSIQTAIDASSNGDTIFVHNGTYYERIKINKSITLIGENKNNTIIIGGGGKGITIYSENGVRISGFTVRNCDTGIFIYSDDNTISDNILKNNNNNGISLWWESSNNKICNNYISGNKKAIYLDSGCRNNTISNNSIENNEIGIYLSKGCEGKNYLLNNIFLNNDQNIYEWHDLTLYFHSIIMILYLSCIIGIVVSIIKHKYRKLVFAFFTIMIGLSLLLIPYFMGGYTVETMQNHFFFYIFGFLILAGFGLILLGIIILIVLFILIKSKNRSLK